MKKFIVFLFVTIIFLSCSSVNEPDSDAVKPNYISFSRSVEFINGIAIMSEGLQIEPCEIDIVFKNNPDLSGNYSHYIQNSLLYRNLTWSDSTIRNLNINFQSAPDSIFVLVNEIYLKK